MSIYKKYIKGDIENNRKSYNSTRITIFLAVLILSTFLFGVSSYFESYRDLISKNTGGYHFRIISPISNKDANNLTFNRHIEKVGFFNTIDLKESFGSKAKTKLFKMDDNAFSTIKSWLKQGRLPEDGEIIISNDMAREIGKTVGDSIEFGGNTYNIVGIYYDTTYEYQEFYNIFLNVNQNSLLNNGEELSPFIWYRSIFRTYSLSEQILDNLETKDITYVYNMVYLNRAFVFDPEDNLLEDYTSHLLVFILFIILIILFYSIIINLFLVQEAKSIEEYAKLKSIGATNNDIGKIIKLKAIYISQIPILLGVAFSFGLVKALFVTINRVDRYFGGNNPYSISNYLDLKLNFKLIIFIYLLSFLIIYVGSKKPVKKLKKISILDGLKGNITGKSYRKYDLKYKGNIEKDLSKQFFKNSKYQFRFTNITLKIGFSLMVFIMVLVTYYSMDKKYNRQIKYESYDIQGEYVTLNPLKEEFIEKIKALSIEDLINFRKESVSFNLDYELLFDEYKDNESLKNLEEEIKGLDNIRVEIFGIEDKKFKELALERGFNPNEYVGNKVILLNTMGDEFNVPLTKIKSIKFFKDNVKELSVSEYKKDNSMGNPGYEFTLNVEDKIETPLFDYGISKKSLNVYMPKSQYVKLFSKFLRIADIDQYEYIIAKTDNIEKIQENVDDISLEYFREKDYSLVSKLDEEKATSKRNIIGSILSIFFSVFFVVVGFSNCYFSFYNLFLRRRDELSLYNAIGMDENLLKKIFQRERKSILFSFIFSMPIIVLAVVYVVSKLSKIFKLTDILFNLNYLFILVILGYILIIYISISKMYNKYKKEIIER